MLCTLIGFLSLVLTLAFLTVETRVVGQLALKIFAKINKTPDYEYDFANYIPFGIMVDLFLVLVVVVSYCLGQQICGH